MNKQSLKTLLYALLALLIIISLFNCFKKESIEEFKRGDLPCPPGRESRYHKRHKKTKCIKCSKGFWKSNDGPGKCTKCYTTYRSGPGFTYKNGATNWDQCVHCGENQIKKQVRSTHWCADCPAGYHPDTNKSFCYEQEEGETGTGIYSEINLTKSEECNPGQLFPVRYNSSKTCQDCEKVPPFSIAGTNWINVEKNGDTPRVVQEKCTDQMAEDEILDYYLSKVNHGANEQEKFDNAVELEKRLINKYGKDEDGIPLWSRRRDFRIGNPRYRFTEKINLHRMVYYSRGQYSRWFGTWQAYPSNEDKKLSLEGLKVRGTLNSDVREQVDNNT